MQVLEIKTRLYKIIDMIQNEDLLHEALHLLDLETETEEIILPKEMGDKIAIAQLEKKEWLLLRAF